MKHAIWLYIGLMILAIEYAINPTSDIISVVGSLFVVMAGVSMVFLNKTEKKVPKRNLAWFRMWE